MPTTRGFPLFKCNQQQGTHYPLRKVPFTFYTFLLEISFSSQSFSPFAFHPLTLALSSEATTSNGFSSLSTGYLFKYLKAAIMALSPPPQLFWSDQICSVSSTTFHKDVSGLSWTVSVGSSDEANHRVQKNYFLP